MSYTITRDYLPAGTKRRSSKKRLGTTFLVLHDTGNDGSTAKGNVSYYKNSANVESASAHTFVDDKDIIECIPVATERAWHVLYNKTIDNKLFGHDANDYAIGVELCYSTKGKFSTKEAYKRYVWYVAKLCVDFKLDPNKHITGHEILDPGRKTDPGNALKTIGKNLKSCIADIYAEYLVQKGTPQTAKATVSAPKTTTTAKSATPSLPTGILKKGDKGADVKALQEALNAAYFYVDKDASNKGVDGIFGVKTEEALKRFQSVYLPKEVDGVYGPNCRKALLEVLVK